MAPKAQSFVYTPPPKQYIMCGSPERKTERVSVQIPETSTFTRLSRVLAVGEGTVRDPPPGVLLACRLLSPAPVLVDSFIFV